MPTPLSPVDVANQALIKIGAQTINSLNDQTSAASLACNTAWPLSYREVARATRWNCLLTTAILSQIAQTPLPGFATATGAITATAWAPHTAYVANSYVTFGGYYYLVLQNYTSSTSFPNDLLAGNMAQTDQQAGSAVTDVFSAYGMGSQYASGWGFQYALPSDFLLLDSVNENTAYGVNSYGDNSSNYEIIGSSLYCNDAQVVVQYVQDTPDTTKFDPLFVNALTLKLASMVATALRQDGGQMEKALLGEYKLALREARAKNAGEKQARRFNPIGSSRFIQSRYRGVNG